MSRYTTTIKRILNSYPQAAGGPGNANPYHSLFYPWQVVDNTHASFFDFDYPFYTTAAPVKMDFEKTFLLRYYDNYIGFETVTMFKAHFIAKMRLIMPKYTEIYNAITAAGFEPLDTTDLTRTQIGANTEGSHTVSARDKDDTDTTDTSGSTTATTTTDSETTDSTNNTTNTQSIHSDNPQVNFSGADYASAMDRGEQTDSGSGSNTVHGTQADVEGRTTHGTVRRVGSDDYDETKSAYANTNDTVTERGRGGGPAGYELIKGYYDNFVNVNKLLIDELRPLFLGVW